MIAPPLLSIIIPALRVDRELRRCVDSVHLALESFTGYEVIVVMPGAHVQSAADALPDVQIVAECRPSVYAAMNDGIKASNGQYLYFLGKDDILLPSVRHLLPTLANERPAAVFAAVFWGGQGRRTCRTSRWQILFFNVCHQGIVYSRNCLDTHGPYVRRFRTHGDHLLNIRLLWDTSLAPRITFASTPIAWYAETGLSSTTLDANFAKVQPAIIRRYLGTWIAWPWSVLTHYRLRWSKKPRA